MMNIATYMAYITLLVLVLSTTFPIVSPMNPYATLNLPPTATASQIKRAYHKLSLKHHPDKIPRDIPPKKRKESEEKFKEVNEAYQCLRDARKKEMYDKYGVFGDSDNMGFNQRQHSGGGGGGGGGGGQQFGGGQFGEINIDELRRVFEEFNSMQQGAGRGYGSHQYHNQGGLGQGLFNMFSGANSFGMPQFGVHQQHQQHQPPPTPPKPSPIHIPFLKTLTDDPNIPLVYTVTKSNKMYTLKIYPTHKAGTVYKFGDAEFSLVLAHPANVVTTKEGDVTYTLRLTEAELAERLKQAREGGLAAEGEQRDTQLKENLEELSIDVVVAEASSRFYIKVPVKLTAPADAGDGSAGFNRVVGKSVVKGKGRWCKKTARGDFIVRVVVTS
jgi:curved DNA-binding protein CbpA